MPHRKLSIALAGVMLAVASFAVSADILFQNLGNGAPPATIGSHTMTPFDLAPQVAIPERSSVSTIPGAPGGALLGISPSGTKYTVGTTWLSTWAGGYLGPVYFLGAQTVTSTLTLPPGTRAFYFYMTPNWINTPFDFTATTDSGTTSGLVPVTSTSARSETIGSNGFAFYSTAGESITSITINAPADAKGMTIGEFGISTHRTCASEGYTYTKLEWCKNICERDYSGSTLKMWIHRWIERYRVLPYCTVN